VSAVVSVVVWALASNVPKEYDMNNVFFKKKVILNINNDSNKIFTVTATFCGIFWA